MHYLRKTFGRIIEIPNDSENESILVILNQFDENNNANPRIASIPIHNANNTILNSSGEPQLNYETKYYAEYCSDLMTILALHSNIIENAAIMGENVRLLTIYSTILLLHHQKYCNGEDEIFEEHCQITKMNKNVLFAMCNIGSEFNLFRLTNEDRSNLINKLMHLINCTGGNQSEFYLFKEITIKFLSAITNDSIMAIQFCRLPQPNISTPCIINLINIFASNTIPESKSELLNLLNNLSKICPFYKSKLLARRDIIPKLIIIISENLDIINSNDPNFVYIPMQTRQDLKNAVEIIHWFSCLGASFIENLEIFRPLFIRGVLTTHIDDFTRRIFTQIVNILNTNQ